MRKNFLLASLIIIVTTLASCNWFTSPEDIKPGRRDYVWEEDTLNVSRGHIRKIWGSSPNDVWAICAAGDYSKTFWHYVGASWTTDNINRGADPLSIFGFASNDIWVGGREGEIWHYDGHVWERVLNLEPKSQWVYSGFDDIWGTSPDNVYAVGFLNIDEVTQGIIFHYDGNEWKRQNIAPEPEVDFLKIRKGDGDHNYYIYAWKTQPFLPDSALIISYNSNSLEVINRGRLNYEEAPYVQLLGNKIYFACFDGIYTYNGAFHEKIKIDRPDWARAFYGRNEQDIFLTMNSGVAHYNGNDIEYLYSYSSKIIEKDMLFFEKEVFILMTDYDNNYDIVRKGVLH